MMTPTGSFRRAAAAIPIILALCLSKVTVSMAEDRPLKLSFIPFKIETVVPITADNIGENGRTFLFQGRHAFVRKLRAALLSHEAKGQLLVKGIRLKADFGPPTGIILADQNGVVLDTTRSVTYRLTQEAMQGIERDVERFVGVVDLTAYEKEPGLKELK